MRKFEIQSENGYAISCMEWLPDGEHDGTVICLHGFGGDKYSSVIAALAASLTKKKKRVLAFDWPAHGDSRAADRDLTVENCIRDLHLVYRRCRQSAADQPISCFATSFGGYLAMIYRQQFPDDFSRIMLRSPALAMPEILISFMTEEERRAFDRGEKRNFGFHRPLLLDRSFYEDLKAYRPLSYEKEDLNGRVFIIHGDRDDVVPLDDSIMFSEKNQIELYVVKGADHRYKHPGELEQIVEQAAAFLGA